MWTRDAGDNRCPVWGTGRRRQSRTDGRRDTTEAEFLQLVYCRPTYSSLVNPVVTERKLMKFLPDVAKLSPLLTRCLALQSSNPLWNASAMNEGGVWQFCQFDSENW